MNDIGLLASQNIHSIGIVRALNLGDLLCTVPAFRALRYAFPQATITLIGLPWATSFVERFSLYLDEHISFPGYPGFPEQTVQTHAFPSFLKEVQSRDFDLLLQMHGSGRTSNSLVELFGAKRLAGYYTQYAHVPSQDTFLPYPNTEHEIHIYLNLLNKLGIPIRGDYLEFPLSNDEAIEGDTIMKKHQLTPHSYICVHPGSRSIKRRWNVENFAEIADHLAEKGYQVIITGTTEEIPLTLALQNTMTYPSLNLAGQTSLGVTAYILQHARLLISNDTGISHIASALRVPSIVLFTASSKERWAPLNTTLHKAIDGLDPRSLDLVKLSTEQFFLQPESYLRRINL